MWLMHWSARLKERLDELGWSPTTLHERSDVAYDSVLKYLAGKVDNPRGDNPAKLAAAMGVRVVWLTHGDGPKYANNTSNDLPSRKTGNTIELRGIPIISSISATKMTAISDPYALGDGEEYASSDPDLGPRSFGMYVDGHSMDSSDPLAQRRFKDGEVVICDPDAAIQPGDFVIAKDPQAEEAVFKKYRPRGVDKNGHEVFDLVPLNDDYETIRSDARRPCVIVGKIVRRIEKF